MAAEIGIFGLLSFFAFVGAVIAMSLKSIRNIASVYYKSLILGLAFGLITFLLHAAVDTSLYSLNLSVLFWLTLGILSSAVAIGRAEQ
jgi:O-antigen ligase